MNRTDNPMIGGATECAVMQFFSQVLTPGGVSVPFLVWSLGTGLFGR